MRIALERVVPGVAPDAALAWWSDFRDGHGDHRFIPGAERRIVSRADGVVTMEERVRPLGLPIFREMSTVAVEGNAVRFHGENTFGAFDGRYLFEPASAGTRVRLEADVRLKRALRWTEAAARPVARAVLAADLRGHAREMARDLVRPGERRRETS